MRGRQCRSLGCGRPNEAHPLRPCGAASRPRELPERDQRAEWHARRVVHGASEPHCVGLSQGVSASRLVIHLSGSSGFSVGDFALNQVRAKFACRRHRRVTQARRNLEPKEEQLNRRERRVTQRLLLQSRSDQGPIVRLESNKWWKNNLCETLRTLRLKCVGPRGIEWVGLRHEAGAAPAVAEPA